MVGLDLKTGKPIPNYQPPPLKFRFDRAAFVSLVGIFGAVSLMFVFVAVHELRKSQQMVKTREMSERDAELKAIADEPEIKRYAREKMIVQFATFVLMIPLPSIAIYRLGIWVFLIYIKFVSIVVGAVNIYLPRPMSK